jgi:hypothetical protein
MRSNFHNNPPNHKHGLVPCFTARNGNRFVSMPPPARGTSLRRPAPIQIVPPRSRRPSTASGKVRHVYEVGELGDDIDKFETMRGLTMAAQGLPEWDDEVATTRKSWAERRDQVEHELRMEELAERFKSGVQRPTRGSQHDLDPCHRRPVPVRPASAAPRPLGLPVTDTARSDALLQSYIDMHRESAERHNMALQEALLEKIRVHKERTQTRRAAQRSTMQLRRDTSRDFAVELQHPYFVKQARGPRSAHGTTHACYARCCLQFPSYHHPMQAAMMRRGQQTQGDWAAVRRQSIYFVPPKLAATMPQMVKGRRSVEQYGAVKQVHDEIERFQALHATDGFA